MAREYINGDYSISQAEAGIDHGLLWVLYRGESEVTYGRTLKRCKQAAAAMGVTGEWSAARLAEPTVVEAKP